MTKKILCLITTLILSAALLASCSSASYKDGTYRAEYDSFDDHGWKDYVELTVQNGSITSVDFDSVNEDGAKKSEDESYRESMEPVSGTYPAKFFPELEDALVEQQDIEKVDAVAGATNSSDSFKDLVKRLLKKNAAKGNTETLVVERAAS